MTRQGIEIRFRHSTSPSYPQAVETAQSVGHYQREGEGRSESHITSIPMERVQDAVLLWDLVGGWKTASMTVNGKSATKRDLTTGPLGNFQKRQEAFDPDAFCYGRGIFNLENRWGCRRLEMPDTYTARWLECGEFNSDGLWLWDTDAIRKLLEPGIHENRVCPAFSEDRVTAALEKLSSPVDPLESSEFQPAWTYEDRLMRATKVVPINEHIQERQSDVVNTRVIKSKDGRYALEGDIRSLVEVEHSLARIESGGSKVKQSGGADSSGCVVILAATIGALVGSAALLFA